MQFRLIKILTLTFAFVVCLGACSGDDNDKPVAGSTPAVDKDTVVYVNYRDLRDLNPHLYGGEMFAQNILYEALVKITDDGIKPWLAESWDISEDGRVYTFNIRKGVTFTDGHPFDAHAVKKNFDAVMDNKQRHTWLEFVRLIESMQVLDDHTFRITFTEPYFPVLIDLGAVRPFRFISPNCMRDGGTKNGVNCHVGTNSYVLKENHIDQYSVFERNESYWGEKPAIKTIVTKVVPDNQTRVLALEKGEIDLIFGTNMIDAETQINFSSKPGFSGIMSPPLGTRMILFNTRDDGALKDVAVRRSVQHAVNKEVISKSIFLGTEPPADTLMAPNVPYCNLKLKAYEYDLARATALLDEAGWVLPDGKNIREKNGTPLATTLYYDSNSVSEKNVSEFLQAELLKIGMRLDIKGEEEQSYRDRQKAGDFGMVFNISWGTPQDPQAFMAAMKLPVYGDFIAQQGLAQKPEIDRRIALALVSNDLEERQSHFTYVFTTLHEEAVYLPLTYECNRAVFKNSLKGVSFNPSRFETPLEKLSW